MLTNDFKFLTLPFTEFNPPQSEAVRFVERDCNIVVALGTATGKTAVAMCFFAYELATKTDTKCAYVSPLRAISQEKIEEFGEVPEWLQHRKVINTGDHFAAPDDFKAARIIILTSETLDSKCRNAKTHGEWLEKIGVLVLDELHLLDDPSRGPALEVGIVNFTRMNPNARLVGLSATMSNAKEVGEWFKALNGKPTFVVASEWRPVRLELLWNGVNDLRRDRWQVEQDMLSSVVKKVEEFPHEKILVFVHAKRLGRELTSELKKRSVMCEFYHSGLKRDERRTLEMLFKQQCGFNVLVTTSALAMGVNL